MKKEHHTDELFRHKLGNHEVAPPEFLWDKIAEQLDQDKKNVRVVWFKRIAVAASLLLAFIAGWQLHQSHNMQLKGDSVSIVKTRNVKQNVVDRGNDYLSIKKESVVKNEHITQAYKSRVEESSVVKAKLPVAKSLQSGAASFGKLKVSSNREVATLAANTISFSGKQIRPTASLEMNVVNADSVKNQALRNLIRIPSIENRKFENTIETALLQKSRINEKSLSETDKLIMTRNLEQLKSPKEKKKLNFSVGAQFASSASFNNPQSSNYAGNSFMATDAVPQPSKVENLKAGMGAGLTFEVKTSKRISIQSGVFYSRLQQGNRGLSVSNDSWPATFTSLMASQPMLVKNNTTWVANSAWGIARIRQYPLDDFKANAVRGDLTTYATTSEGVDFNQQAEYIEVPLLLRYKLFEHRFRFDLLGGLGANFLVGNDFYQISKGERVSIGKTDDMNNFSYSSIMGMGMSYGLTPTIRISLEPKLKYFLNSLSNSATVDMKPWIFGVYAGLNFNF